MTASTSCSMGAPVPKKLNRLPRRSQEAEQPPWHMKDIHDEVHKQIAKTNKNYKQHADARRFHVEFNEGEMVMVRMKPEQYPAGT